MAESTAGRTTLAALLAHVQPTFLGPAVAMAAVGGLLAPTVDLGALVVHAAAVGTAVYVAHLQDGYVDRFVRAEEPPGGTTACGLRAAIAVCSVGFAALVLWLTIAVGALAAVVTVPLWLLAVAHAPYLDTGPIGVTVDYAVGVAVALAGGFAVQTGTVTAPVAAAAVVYLVLLAAVKVSVDQLDRAFDRSVGKRTVPVVTGAARADRVAAGLSIGAGALVAALCLVGVFPMLAVPSAAVACCVAAAVFVRPRRRSVRLQILLTYPFTAVLFAGICVGTASTCGRLLGAVL